MYKVFINEVSVFLVTKDMWLDIQGEYQNDEAAEFHFQQENLDPEPLLKKWEACSIAKTVLLIGEDIEELKKTFLNHFTVIKAGGGVVQNDQEEILLIFRRGLWDLPKGKLDNGESIKECALREVKEETGLTHLKVEKQILFPGMLNKGMMHVYKENGQRILKITYWYEMKNLQKTTLKPEEKEGITEVKWVNPSDLHHFTKNTYRSLRDIFQQYSREIL